MEKVVFDGSIEKIKWIVKHEDYKPMVNKAVLTMVGPLLRDSDGFPYKRKTGQRKNGFTKFFILLDVCHAQALIPS